MQSDSKSTLVLDYVKPVPYLLVIDTNVLWSGTHPSDLHHPSFSKLLSKCRGFATVELFVPEIVKKERIYQAVAALKIVLTNAKGNLETLNRLKPVEVELPTEDEVKALAPERFDEWLKDSEGTLLTINYADIDWSQVVDDCVWRNPPFSPAELDKPTEKGFRDYLVLHALEILQAEWIGHGTVVFVSGDNLLRETASARFKSDKFSAYRKAGDFLDFLKVRGEKFDKAFSNSVIEKAPSIFEESVLETFHILTKIQTGYQSKLKPPRMESSDVGGFLSLIQHEYILTSQRLDIVRTRYDKFKDGRHFWRTRIILKQAFRSENVALVHAWRIRMSHFDVNWSSQIDMTFKFYNFDEPEVSMVGQTEEFGMAAVVAHGLSLGFPENSLSEQLSKSIGGTASIVIPDWPDVAGTSEESAWGKEEI